MRVLYGRVTLRLRFLVYKMILSFWGWRSGGSGGAKVSEHFCRVHIDTRVRKQVALSSHVPSYGCWLRFSPSPSEEA